MISWKHKKFKQTNCTLFFNMAFSRPVILSTNIDAEVLTSDQLNLVWLSLYFSFLEFVKLFESVDSFTGFRKFSAILIKYCFFPILVSSPKLLLNLADALRRRCLKQMLLLETGFISPLLWDCSLFWAAISKMLPHLPSAPGLHKWTAGEHGLCAHRDYEVSKWSSQPHTMSKSFDGFSFSR